MFGNRISLNITSIPPYEVEETLKVPLCDERSQNEQIWVYNPIGQFTMRSVYELVLQAKIITTSEGYFSESAIEKF